MRMKTRSSSLLDLAQVELAEIDEGRPDLCNRPDKRSDSSSTHRAAITKRESATGRPATALLDYPGLKMMNRLVFAASPKSWLSFVALCTGLAM